MNFAKFINQMTTFVGPVCLMAWQKHHITWIENLSHGQQMISDIKHCCIVKALALIILASHPYATLHIAKSVDITAVKGNKRGF